MRKLGLAITNKDLFTIKMSSQRSVEGWFKYENKEYGFELWYPPYAKIIPESAPTSVDKKGISIGSATFVILDTQESKDRALNHMKRYLNEARHPLKDSWIRCSDEKINILAVLTDYIECGGEGGYLFSTLIKVKGKKFDIFVEGSSNPETPEWIDKLGRLEFGDLLVMLSSLRFTSQNQLQKFCLITGCSKQICSDQEILTTCEYKPEYACYRAAKCERQQNGLCGWTQDEALVQCIEGMHPST